MADGDRPRGTERSRHDQAEQPMTTRLR